MKVLVGLLFMACTQCHFPKEEKHEKLFDLGAFTMITPTSWKKLDDKGIDSYAGKIAIDDDDTLEFDFGWYANTLSEEPMIMERRAMPDTANFDSADVIIVDRLTSTDIDRYRYNNVTWDTIDGRLAKLVYPRRSGVGMTGVYIDSVYVQQRGEVIRFNCYGVNIKPANEQRVLDAIRTIKFRHAKKS